MRKRICCAVGILCLVFLSVPSTFAQEAVQPAKKTLATSGTAKVSFDPNRARVYLGIATVEQTVSAARQANAAKIEQVFSAIKALKIKDALIKAPSYNVIIVSEPEYDATRAGRLPKIVGYRVVQEFTVLLQDKDVAALSRDAASVVDTALENGVNMIQNIEFFKDDDSEHKREALARAVQDAMANAKAMADAAGLAVSEYIVIGSNLNYWQPQFLVTHAQQRMMADEVSSASTLIAGKISIECNVSLQCTTEKK